jgi:aspartyl-tRNA synthetase
MGWVHGRRDHGGVIFIDLRDRSGLVQLVFNPAFDPESHRVAEQLRGEYVLAVIGEVVPRSEETVNPDLATGEIEIRATAVELLNEACTVPFPIDDEMEVAESTRLRYRYLDLRRPAMQKNFELRHRLCKVLRDDLDRQGFLEVETPMLTRSTPEGARDYLVPSRVNPGRFYALPQSPQLFKQLLMVGGFERYFQIVRCFRDEDLRADRQPEFTQLDLEMAFVNDADVRELTEQLMIDTFRVTRGIDLSAPFPVIPWSEAMRRWGSDKPDTRFGLEILEFSEGFRVSGFKVFRNVLEKGGVIRGFKVDGRNLSRKDLDDLVDLAGTYGAKGLVWIRVNEDAWQSPVAKFLSDEEKAAAKRVADLEIGDVLFLVADQEREASLILGSLRLHLGKQLGLIDESKWNFLWVNEFPLFEWSPEEKRHVAVHHPFTAPCEEDLDLLEQDPGRVRSLAYDLVLNGSEIGGGSIRIHRMDVQERVFRALGISAEEAREKFGFLLDALSYGAPPHGGIALGLDRFAMFLCGESSIREVIAFPKTQKAQCLMTQAPSEVDRRQLRDLHVRVQT